MGNRNFKPSYADRLVDQREFSWMDRPSKHPWNDRYNLELREYDDFMFMDGALPNVPPNHWQTRRRVWQKVMMACLCVLGPEFIFQLALGQWESARRSVKTFQKSGYQRWTLKHAFFADMGGFILHCDDWVPFPVNAKQLHYLVTEGYLPFSAVNLDAGTIEDKNKGDMFARCIAITQILWFTVNYFARWHQRLASTTLELTTLGFIFCTLGTYFCWASKPKDVIGPIILHPSERLCDILKRAGDTAKHPYKNTPLDFVGYDQWSWTLYWKYWLNVLDRLHIVLSSKQRPLIKIPDDNFPHLLLQRFVSSA